MSSRRLMSVSIVGILLLGGLIVTTLREDPIQVDLSPVEHGSLVVTVGAEGQAQVRDTFDVSAPVTETLQRFPLEVDDTVVGHQTIVASVEPIESPLLDARARTEAVAFLNEAEACIRFAQAEVVRITVEARFAQSDFDRIKSLTEAGTSSITQLEAASLRLATTKAAATSVETQLAMAEATRERSRAVLIEPAQSELSDQRCVQLVAPANGVILSQSAVSAHLVVAGERLLSIGDPSNLEVVVCLLSSDAACLRIGTDAYLERLSGGDPVPAKLKWLEPTARTDVSALGIEEQRVDAVLDITASHEKWRGLGLGLGLGEGDQVVPHTPNTISDDRKIVERERFQGTSHAPVQVLERQEAARALDRQVNRDAPW